MPLLSPEGYSGTYVILYILWILFSSNPGGSKRLFRYVPCHLSSTILSLPSSITRYLLYGTGTGHSNLDLSSNNPGPIPPALPETASAHRYVRYVRIALLHYKVYMCVCTWHIYKRGEEFSMVRTFVNRE
jgi:hypothetical protein